MTTSLPPVRTGLAVAATAAVLYLACALLALVAPGMLIDLLATMAHGLDIEPLFRRAPTLSALAVVTGTLAVASYGFLAGALFALWFGLLGRRPDAG
ncbi:MAG: DUF5676 family membrane protein [Pseudomonadota bacterium]